MILKGKTQVLRKKQKGRDLSENDYAIAPYTLMYVLDFQKYKLRITFKYPVRTAQ